MLSSLADVASSSDVPDPCFAVPFCPICRVGQMRMTYRTSRLAICVCMSCETSLSVPDTAWGMAPLPAAGYDAPSDPQA